MNSRASERRVDRLALVLQLAVLQGGVLLAEGVLQHRQVRLQIHALLAASRFAPQSPATVTPKSLSIRIVMQPSWIPQHQPCISASASLQKKMQVHLPVGAFAFIEKSNWKSRGYGFIRKRMFPLCLGSLRALPWLASSPCFMNLAPQADHLRDKGGRHRSTIGGLSQRAAREL